MREKLERLERDFEQGNGPFSDVQFPEERLLKKLTLDTAEDKLRAISLFSTLDYNRDANQLVDNLIELHERKPHWFDAWHIGHGAIDDGLIEDVFEEIGFRYPSRDANGWETNCTILLDNYSGKWHELLLDTGCNGPNLVERLNEDGFLYMKGIKIAPMYARIINDEVAPLSDLWKLEIPVDTHIRRLSKDLFAADISDDTIRREWRGLAEAADIERHIVDGALWHIGNKWDKWGEEYWNKVME